MALQEAVSQDRPNPANVADQAKVDRATAAMADVRGMLRRANGNATRALGEAVRRGIDTHNLCRDALAGRDNPLCRAIRGC